MSSQVIVFVTDERYLPHYKSLAVNCRNEGQYTGDFLCICPDTGEPWIDDLASRDFQIVHVPDRTFFAKFNVFHPDVRQWDRAMYLDADIIVQSALQPLFDQLESLPRDDSGGKPIIAGVEDQPAIMVWERNAIKAENGDPLLDRLLAEYPCVREQFWNTSTMIFEPSSIPDGTIETLRSLQIEFHAINDPDKDGTDQQIMHICLFDRFSQVKDKGFCYWGLDEFASRVPSVGRGWRGDEIPVVVHYCRWYAPWIVKTPDADAYDNNRIGRVCHEFYSDNLAAFDEIFPIKG